MGVFKSHLGSVSGLRVLVFAAQIAFVSISHANDKCTTAKDSSGTVIATCEKNQSMGVLAGRDFTFGDRLVVQNLTSRIYTPASGIDYQAASGSGVIFVDVTADVSAYGLETLGQGVHGIIATGTAHNGSSGGDGGLLSGADVKVTGEVLANASNSHGIFVQAVGGSGGSGSTSTSGGKGGTGGGGTGMSVSGRDAGGTGVSTLGSSEAAAVLLNHVGGHGGSGGDGDLGSGGSGGSGGPGASISSMSNTGNWTLSTVGTNSPGLAITSTAGNGGSGGVGYVGDGGNGGAGGRVSAHVLQIGPGDLGAWTITTKGSGSDAISMNFLGGNGGGGGTGSGHGGSAGAAGSGAGMLLWVPLAPSYSASLNLATAADDSAGIRVLSTSGNGGKGGNSDLYAGKGGASGGSGSLIQLGATSQQMSSGFPKLNASIATKGDRSIGIYMQSTGGKGGTGGNGNIASNGGSGGTGGTGGQISATGDFTITTGGDGAHGIAVYSLGGEGGAGGKGGFIGGSGGAGGNTGANGLLTLDLSGSITTSGAEAHGVIAQNIAGHGGDAGSCIGTICFASSGGSAGAGGTITMTNKAAIATKADQSGALVAQSIGGGGGNGGDTFALFYGQGGTGSIGGAGGQITVSNDGALTTFGNDAIGIYAQSIGGTGGDGGTSDGLIVLGGGGSAASSGGTVSVTNTGLIDVGNQSLSSNGTSTAGDDPTCGAGCSHGILAQSIGGGGGNAGSAGGIISIGADGGGGGNGGKMTVNNMADITTHLDQSSAIIAQSIGGGGGIGGSAAAVSIGGSLAWGGSGSAGGDGGITEVQSTHGAHLTTSGTGSFAISAQSIGGGGGHGGFGASVTLGAGGGAALGIGGSGGSGGAGKMVTVTTVDDSYSGPAGTITTAGANAHGIYAQSIGGGGGAGGAAIAVEAGVTVGAVALSIGGSGASGGSAGEVDVTNDMAIDTAGDSAIAVFAQSVGGGGGSGGFSVSGQLSFDSGGGISAAQGGTGGAGGTGGVVNVTNTGAILTKGASAHAIMAQSHGGGGGDGNLAVSGAIEADGGASISLTNGGSGGTGQHAGNVTVTNGTPDIEPKITTTGGGAAGIFAQSVGGGGGSGGVAVSATITGDQGVAASVSHGGSGGSGGDGGSVTVANLSTIVTGNPGDGGDLDDVSANAHGIFAQSVGGGGGSGGISGSVAIGAGSESTAYNASIALGGTGGSGGNGGAVSVNNSQYYVGTSMTSYSDQSHGVFAQSVGGGGGDGGSSFAGTIELFSGNTSTYQADVSVGGAGSVGGDGGTVTFYGNGPVTRTYGDASHGLFVSSVGGGGGTGGSAKSFVYNMKCQASGSQTDCPDGSQQNKSYNFSFDIGGKGGKGGSGGTVSINHNENVFTYGDGSAAIMIYSIGGGGGDGGNASSLELKNYQQAIKSLSNRAGVKSNLDIYVGGKGGAAGNGGYVQVMQSNGNLQTAGLNSPGVFAQSIGGGGGRGGAGVAGATGKVSIGGDGGAAGDGNTVSVTLTDTNITTGIPPGLADDPDNGPRLPDASYGIFAQSVGGGGGVGGNMSLCGECSAIPGAPSSTSIGVALGWNGGGGKGGHGGAVSVNAAGDITTYGESAAGIFAQSVGGGGGTAGTAGLVDLANVTSLVGSTGLNGDGGIVTVTYDGTLTTSAGGATGIFAQSAGGTGGQPGDGGSAVNVTVSGSVSVSGEDASAILAQSVYTEPNGTGVQAVGADKITVTLNAGSTVQGGFPGSNPSTAVQTGAGVEFLGGIDNSLMNHGTISSLGGPAVAQSGLQPDSTSGLVDAKLTIDNYGQIIGDLSGVNIMVNNHTTGAVNTGGALALGTDGSFHNDGLVNIRNYDNIGISTISADFSQSRAGTMAVDLTAVSGPQKGLHADLLAINGSADLAGTVKVKLLGPGLGMPGRRSITLIEATNGLTAGQLTVVPSAVAQFQLDSTASSVDLSYDVDFNNPAATSGISGNQREIATHLADQHSAGGIGPELLFLTEAQDASAYGKDLETLSPAAYGVGAAASLLAGMHFADSLLSCQEREGQNRFIREADCLRLDVSGRRYEQDSTANTPGFALSWGGIAIGGQREVSEGWIVGLGIGYDGLNGSSDTDLWNSDGEQFQAGMVVKRQFGGSLLAVSLGGGIGNSDVRRNILPGVIAQANQDIQFASGQLRGAHAFDLTNWYVKPIADLNLSYVNTDSATETGAGAANLRIDGSSDFYAAFRPSIEAGLELTAVGGAIIRPRASIGLTYFLTDPSQSTTARLAGAAPGSTSFTVQNDMDRTSVDIEAGLTLFSNRDVQFSASAVGQFSQNATNLGGNMRLSIEF